MHFWEKKNMPVFIIKLKSSSGYHNNNRPTLGPVKQNIVHPEPHDNTVPRSQYIPSMPGLDDWFDVFTSRFLFTLQVRSASMVCRSSGIQLLEKDYISNHIGRNYTFSLTVDNNTKCTNLEARTGFGLPHNSFREERSRVCDIYKAASRPGTYSRTTLGIRGLFWKPTSGIFAVLIKIVNICERWQITYN